MGGPFRIDASRTSKRATSARWGYGLSSAARSRSRSLRWLRPNQGQLPRGGGIARARVDPAIFCHRPPPTVTRYRANPRRSGPRPHPLPMGPVNTRLRCLPAATVILSPARMWDRLTDPWTSDFFSPRYRASRVESYIFHLRYSDRLSLPRAWMLQHRHVCHRQVSTRWPRRRQRPLSVPITYF